MTNQTMNNFITFLKKAFENSDLNSYSELAEQAGVDRSYISLIFNGKRPNPPSPEIIDKLAKVLNADYNEMMTAAGYIKRYEKPEDNIETSEKVKILKKIFNDLEIDYIEVIDEAKEKGLTPKELKTLIEISDQFKDLFKKD